MMKDIAVADADLTNGPSQDCREREVKSVQEGTEVALQETEVVVYQEDREVRAPTGNSDRHDREAFNRAPNRKRPAEDIEATVEHRRLDHRALPVIDSLGQPCGISRANKLNRFLFVFCALLHPSNMTEHRPTTVVANNNLRF